MTNIDVKFKFGNNNSFDMKLPLTVNGMFLYERFLEITRVRPETVKYLVCNGKILDTKTVLKDLKIFGKKVLVHVIVSNELKGEYPMDEIFQNEYKLYYDIAQENSVITRSYQQNINNFTDVVVKLTDSQFDELTSSVVLNAEDIDVGSLDEATCFCGDDDNIELARTRTWLPCGHAFHTQCIKQYLTTTSVKCPMCDTDVRGEST